MKLEQRKNIFLFNVNKDDLKNLSELDLFNECNNDEAAQGKGAIQRE